MKEIRATAGERVRVIRRAFSSVPMDYRFSARAAKPGELLAGSVEVKRSRWILPGSPISIPLEESNLLQAGFWTTFMSVDVVPAVDTVITVEGRGIRQGTPILMLAVVTAIVVAALLVMFKG